MFDGEETCLIRVMMPNIAGASSVFATFKQFPDDNK